MDPATLELVVSSLSSGLTTAFITLATKGVVDPALEKGLEPFSEWLTRGYKKKKLDKELRQAVKKVIEEATDALDDSKSTEHPWMSILAQIKDDPRLAARVAAVAVEMTKETPERVPSDLLREFKFTDQQRDAFAGFLFLLRKELIGIEAFAPGIDYADKLDARQMLAGLYELVSGLEQVVADASNGKVLRVQVVPSDISAREQNYLSNVLNEYRRLSLDGRSRIDSVQPNSPLHLERVYITINTTVSRYLPISAQEKIAHGLKGHFASDVQEEPLSCLRFVTETRRVILLGDPGSGKTVFTQHLCLCLAGSRCAPASDWPNQLKAGDLGAWNLPFYPFPVFIRLRLFGHDMQALPKDPHQMGRAEHLLAFICKEMSLLGMDEAKNHLLSLLRNGQILIALDGLDEVTHPDPNGSDAGRREKAAQAIQHFSQRFPNARLLVTCRTKQYPVDSQNQPTRAWRLPGFAIARIRNFTPEQVEMFVSRWFTEMSKRGRLRDKNNLAYKQETLLQVIENSEELSQLAQKPIVLTQMALIHTYKYLPTSRVRVYEECADLLLWEWERLRALHSGRQGESSRDFLGKLIFGLRQEEVEDALDRAVFLAHKEGTPDIPREKVRSSLSDLFHRVYRLSYPKAVGCAEKFMLDWLDLRNGLLIPAGENTYTVPHRSFREFMAGRFLRENRLPCPEDDTVEEDWKLSGSRLVKADMDTWREPFCFAAGLENSPAEVAVAMNELIPEHLTYDEEKIDIVLLAGELARYIGGRTLKMRSKLGQQVYDHLREYLVELMYDTFPAKRSCSHNTPDKSSILPQPLSPQIRFSAGELLDDLGWIPWDLDNFVEFYLGTEQLWMSKYPITNLQFQRFVEAEDYADPELWQSVKCFDVDGNLLSNVGEEAWNWFKRNGGSKHRPSEWGNSRFGVHRRLFPVVGVTWYESAAYCCWLKRHQEYAKGLSPDRNLSFRLPTEAEWEVAAGGAEDKRYPWQRISESVTLETALSYMNTEESRLHGTSPVCMYPKGASPVGIMDLSGNVWEWQANLTDQQSAYRRLKGGGWYLGLEFACVGARNHTRPTTAWRYTGFRVLATSVHEESPD